MRPAETLDFEGVDVAAEVEDGAGDLVVLAGRAELVVAINEVEDTGVGETMIVKVADTVVGSPVLDVGCEVSSDSVSFSESFFDFFV